MVPGVVIVVVATFHTAAGSAVIDEVMELSERPSEVDAVSTVAFVLAFMTAASEEEAVCTVVFVFPFMTAAREDEAVSTVLFVFAFTTAAIELEAVCTSLSVARLPEVSPAPVRVRVAAPQMSAAIAVPDVRVREPADQMSATSVPNDVRVLPENDHMEFGSVAESEDDALETTVFVFAFTRAATEEEETMLSVISKVLSPRTRLPFPEEPHVM